MAGHLTQGSRNIDMPEEKKGSMEDRTADSEGQLYWRPLFFLHGENHQGGSQEEQGPWEISYTKMGATKRHHGTGRGNRKTPFSQLPLRPLTSIQGSHPTACGQNTSESRTWPLGISKETADRAGNRIDRTPPQPQTLWQTRFMSTAGVSHTDQSPVCSGLNPFTG